MGRRCRVSRASTKRLLGACEQAGQQLEGEVKKLLELAQQADQEAEAEQQELDIPEELQVERNGWQRSRKRRRIEERAQEPYEAERAEYEAKLKRRQERAAAPGKKVGGKPPKEPEAGPKDKDQVNFTDEESRIMPGANGDFIQGYNAQAVVEQAHGGGDACEMEPALNELRTGQAGSARMPYHSKENRCWNRHRPYIAGSRERHNQPLEDRLDAPPECPADADAVTAMKHRSDGVGRRSIASGSPRWRRCSG